MYLKCILVLCLLVLRYPFVEVSYHALNLLDSAKSSSVIVVKLVLSHKVGSRCLRHVHFLVQMFDPSYIVPYGSVKEGSIGSEVPVRGEVATNRWSFLYKGSCIVRDWYESVVLEFRTDSVEHCFEVEWVQVCPSVLNRESFLVVPCYHFDELDDRFACLGGELNVVRVKFVVELVISAVVFGFF